MNTIQKSIFDKIRITDFFIVLIGVLSIVPFLIISIYANPSADDFDYHNMANTYGFIDAQLLWYNKWSGRYFSTAVLSIQSLVEKPYYIYKLIPILLLISLFYSVFKITHLVIGNVNKKQCLIFTFLFMIVYLIQMPTVAEGFFWLAGSVTYQLSNLIFIWFIYFLLKLIESNTINYFIITTLLLVILIGSNETTMLLVDLLLVSILGFNCIKTKKLNYKLVSIMLMALLCSAIVYLSPGNSIRAASFPDKHKMVFSILKTISSVSSYLAIWLPFMIISVLIYSDYFRKKHKKIESNFLNVSPYLVLFFLCSMLFLGFFTCYWSVGRMPPVRAINTIYLLFLLGFMYFIFVLLMKFKTEIFYFSKEVKYLLIVLIFFQLGKNNNIKTAYKDLLSGDARHFNLELENRYHLLLNNGKGKCIVPQLKYKPLTIFSGDISSNPNYWKNESYSIYFAKKSIQTK